MDTETKPQESGTYHPNGAFEQVFPVFTNPVVAPRSGSEKGRNVSVISKPVRKAAMRSTLFWVNSDQKSVQAGSREETLKRIRSHVMSEHNRKKRLENTRRYKSKAWKSIAFRPVEAGSAEPSPTFSDGSISKDSNWVSESDDSSFRSPSLSDRNTPPPLGSRKSSLGGSFEVFQATPPATTPEWEIVVAKNNPWSHVGQGLTDPFASSQVPLSNRMAGHLQFFLGDLVTMAVPFTSRHYVIKLRKYWSSLVQEWPATLQAVLTSASTNKALISGDAFADSITQRNSSFILDRLHHRGETIRLVNEGLSNPTTAASDPLIAAVSTLISIEIASAQVEDMHIHLTGLRRMVELRDDFADIHPEVRRQIEWTDIRAACFDLTKPLFPFVRCVRPTDLPALISLNTGLFLASGLLALTEIPGLFSEEMIASIHDLLELTLFSELTRTDPGRAAELFNGEAEEYFATEVIYTEYCLFNDRFTPSGVLKGDDSIEGGVRLACLLFHSTYIWGFFPRLAVVLPRPVLALEESLRQGMATGLYDLCQDLLIWMLFVGACAAKYLPSRSFFTCELANAVSLQGVLTFDEFHQLLQEFFYVDNCYLEECRDIWDEVQLLRMA